MDQRELSLRHVATVRLLALCIVLVIIMFVLGVRIGKSYAYAHARSAEPVSA